MDTLCFAVNCFQFVSRIHIKLFGGAMKSSVRVKAFGLLVFVPLGVAQAFSLVPWYADSPIMLGALILAWAGIVTVRLVCEECGESMLGAVLKLGEFEGEERKYKRRELLRKGNSLFPYRKRCLHCSMERH
jgi:hypothetical protein